MLVSFARAAGLAAASEPWVGAGQRLLQAWLRGRGWDPAREPNDPYRMTRGAAAVGSEGVRRRLVALLSEVPPLVFVSLDDLRDIVLLEPEGRAMSRRIEAPLDAAGAVEAELLEVLPALGVVDVADDAPGAVLRLSAHGRRWLDPARSAPRCEPQGDGWPVPAAASAREVVRLGAIGLLWPSGTGLVFRPDETRIRAAAERRELEGHRAAAVQVLGDDPELLAALRARFAVDVVDVSRVLRGSEALCSHLLAGDPEGEMFISGGLPTELWVRAGVPGPALERCLEEAGAVPTSLKKESK